MVCTLEHRLKSTGLLKRLSVETLFAQFRRTQQADAESTQFGLAEVLGGTQDDYGGQEENTPKGHPEDYRRASWPDTRNRVSGLEQFGGGTIHSRTHQTTHFTSCPRTQLPPQFFCANAAPQTYLHDWRDSFTDWRRLRLASHQRNRALPATAQFLLFDGGTPARPKTDGHLLATSSFAWCRGSDHSGYLRHRGNVRTNRSRGRAPAGSWRHQHYIGSQKSSTPRTG